MSLKQFPEKMDVICISAVSANGKMLSCSENLTQKPDLKIKVLAVTIHLSNFARKSLNT